MNKFGAIFFICFVVGILGLAFFLNNDAQQHDCKDSFNGIVQSQEYNIQRDMEVEVNNSLHSLWGFAIKEGDNVLIGDSLYKEKCSKKMVVYRKDSLTNEYKLVEYHYLTGNCDDCE